MGATARDSVLYAALHTNKYIGDARYHRGRVVPLYWEFTVVSASAGADTYNLNVIPAHHRVVSAYAIVTIGMGASAGAGRTLQVGDANDDDRYIAAFDSDLAGAAAHLAATGAGFTPTVDTPFIAKAHATNAWVVGSAAKGVILTVAP
jgi:hypothetical protein